MSTPNTGTPSAVASAARQRRRPQLLAFDVNGARIAAMFLICFAHVAQGMDVGYYFGDHASLIWSIVEPGLCVFFLLSGMSWRMMYEPVGSWGGYCAFLRDSCWRYVLPYVSLNVLASLLAEGAARMHATRPLSGFAMLANLLWDPLAIPAKQLWFLFVLVEMIALLPILARCMASARLAWCVVVAACVIPRSVHLPECLALARCAEYLPFFLVGYLYGVGPRSRLITQTVAGAGVWLVCTGVLTGGAIGVGLPPGLRRLLMETLLLLRPLGGAYALIGAAGAIAGRFTRSRRALGTLGIATLDIYLLHYPYVVSPLTTVLRAMHLQARPGILWCLAICAAGVCIPVTFLLGRGIRRSPWAAYVLLGVGRFGALWKSSTDRGGACPPPP